MKERAPAEQIFQTASDNAVKSITQRRLLRYWERIRGANVLPAWTQIDHAEIAEIRDNLCVMEVRRESGATRYRVREHGTKLGEYYGNRCAGRHLDEFMSPEALAALTSKYDRAAGSQRPVYTITPITDRHGRSVTCERLLLPFMLSGASAEVVLASIEAISIDGAFEHRQVLLPSQQRATDPGFQSVIGAAV